MQQKGIIRIGPGASSLILIFVMLSLSVLAMLSLVGGNNDRQMSLRSVQVAEEIYALNEQAEQTRAALGGIFAASRENAKDEAEYRALVAQAVSGMENSIEGLIAESDRMIWQEKDGTYTLDCAVAFDPYQFDTVNADEKTGAAWLNHKLTADRAMMEDDLEEWD